MGFGTTSTLLSFCLNLGIKGGKSIDRDDLELFGDEVDRRTVRDTMDGRTKEMKAEIAVFISYKTRAAADRLDGLEVLDE